MPSLGWLHITDLHVGQRGSDWRHPALLEAFRRDLEGCAGLAALHGLPWGPRSCQQLLRHTGGHPRLVREALYHAATAPPPPAAPPAVEELVSICRGPLDALYWSFDSHPRLMASFRAVLRQEDAPDGPRLDDATCNRLVDAGLLRRRDEQFSVRYPLLGRYIRAHRRGEDPVPP